jgi:hypothetical protein
MRKALVDAGRTSVAMPRIGCGIDSLSWEKVEDILRRVFQNSVIQVTVYSLPSPRIAVIKTITQGTSLTVPTTIQGVPVEAIFDTAAEVTVLSKDFYQSLENPPRLGESVSIKSAAIDGQMTAWKCSGVQFLIGTQKYILNVHVAPITDNILLGLDFLSEHGAIINLEEGSLSLPVSPVSGNSVSYEGSPNQTKP